MITIYEAVASAIVQSFIHTVMHIRLIDFLVCKRNYSPSTSIFIGSIYQLSCACLVVTIVANLSISLYASCFMAHIMTTIILSFTNSIIYNYSMYLEDVESTVVDELDTPK